MIEPSLILRKIHGVGKIISGGQTGADQGALEGAKAVGLETGGMMPYGYKTDDGPNEALAKLYNLEIHASDKYPPRTKYNVQHSDGTLVFGDFTSPGCKLTIKYCGQFKKPYTIIGWQRNENDPHHSLWLKTGAIYLRDWCKVNGILILNVAGNRERTNPGIHDAVKALIMETFRA